MLQQKVVIIDDLKNAIEDLKDNLSKYEHLKVVGHASTSEDAITVIKKHKPDIVFLDVQLEIDGTTGFDLLKKLKEKKMVDFVIVFYTSYEKYAVEAIRASAFDFLTKPVDPLQLSIIISRIQANPVFNTNTNVEKLIDQLAPSRKIALQTFKGIRFVKLQSIVFMTVERSQGFLNRGGQVAVCLIDGETIQLSGNVTLKKLKEMINDENFFDISRQTIVNLHYLQEVEQRYDEKGNKYNVSIMSDPYAGVELVVSRNQMTELRRRFSLS